MKHREQSLADSGIDFTGGSVLISCFWTGFGTRITEHHAGDNQFSFDTEFGGSGSLQKEAVHYVMDRVEWDNPRIHNKSTHGSIHFFLMGLAALDIPEEWAYHAESRTLFFVSPDGQTPRGVRGKRRDYAVSVKNSTHVHLRGMDFFGTAALLDDCTDSRIEDCNFRFSAYN